MSTAAKTYTWHREGNGRVLDHANLTLHQTLVMVGQSIYDNGYASKADAQRFSATLKVGEPAEFGPYTFTVGKMPRKPAGVIA